MPVGRGDRSATTAADGGLPDILWALMRGETSVACRADLAGDYHLDESAAKHEEPTGPPADLEQFVIPVPAQLRGSAVAAAVGVPVA